MHIRFKHPITVTAHVENHYGEYVSKSMTFKEGEILKVGSVKIFGQPNQKIKTRPWQRGGKKTLLRVRLFDFEQERAREQDYLVQTFDPGSFIVDGELIEIIPNTLPNHPHSEALADHNSFES